MKLRKSVGPPTLNMGTAVDEQCRVIMHFLEQIHSS
jgi:hypothetical protein